MVEELERLAGERDVPVARVDKGVLNTLCGSCPHQVSILVNVCYCCCCYVLLLENSLFVFYSTLKNTPSTNPPPKTTNSH